MNANERAKAKRFGRMCMWEEREEKEMRRESITFHRVMYTNTYPLETIRRL